MKLTEDGPTPGAADEGAGVGRAKEPAAKRAYQRPVIISYTNEAIREKLGPAMAVPECSGTPPPR